MQRSGNITAATADSEVYDIVKTRIFSALVGLAVLGAFFAFYNTVAADIVVTVISILGIWEAYHAAGITKKHKAVFIIAALFGCLMTNIPTVGASGYYGVILLVFAYTLLHHRDFSVMDTIYSVLMGTALPLAFHLFISLRNQFGAEQGILYLVFLLGSAWWCDTGGYFAGCLFGKHKLCPEISPKKTVEGLIGGLVITVLGNIGLLMLIASLCGRGIGFLAQPVQLNLLRIALYSPILALIGVLGDLSFSAIKRHFGIKDYGNIMPGHGGVLDRFDSVLFIAPAIYFIASTPAFSIVL